MNRRIGLIILGIVLTIVTLGSLAGLVWPSSQYAAKAGEPIFVNGGDRIVITETVRLADSGATSTNYFEFNKVGASATITATQIGRGFAATAGNLTTGTWEVKGKQITVDLVASVLPTIVENRVRWPWAILMIFAAILAAVAWILGLSAESMPTAPADETALVTDTTTPTSNVRPSGGNRVGNFVYPRSGGRIWLRDR